MGDVTWVQCSGCGLPHSRRPDAACPRCQTPDPSENFDTSTQDLAGRRPWALLVTVALALVAVAVVVYVFTPPSGRAAALAGHLAGGYVSVIEGEALPYRISLTNGRWQAMAPASMRALNPDVDRWVVDLDAEAHVLAIAEEIRPGEILGLDEYQRQVLALMRANNPELRLRGERDLAVAGADARILHLDRFAADESSGDFEEYLGLYSGEGGVFRVAAMTTPPRFPVLADRFEAILASVQPPPARRPDSVAWRGGEGVRGGGTRADQSRRTAGEPVASPSVPADRSLAALVRTIESLQRDLLRAEAADSNQSAATVATIQSRLESANEDLRRALLDAPPPAPKEERAREEDPPHPAA
jgi:hypothetical protein